MYGKRLNQRATTCLLVLQLFRICLSWNADAGLIRSLTKGNTVKVTATSSVQAANRTLDGDDNTNWVSSFCLPNGYIKRSDVNILFGACASGDRFCSTSSNTPNDTAHATDGSVYTVAHINTGAASTAAFTITVEPKSRLNVITVNGIFSANTTLYAHEHTATGNTIRHIFRVFSNSDNYKDIQIYDAENISVSKLEMESNTRFAIKEIAAIGPYGCHEQVTVDLGSLHRVGMIRTRHWAGLKAASSLVMKTSVDGVRWTDVKTLNPEAVHAVTTSIPPQNIRYIALNYKVNLQPYKKVFCFEIDAWDEHGIWGPRTNAKPQTRTLRYILGVNGIWGWGHSMYSDLLTTCQGPQLYNKVASHARNYHNLNWDVTDPDFDPEFTQMAAGNGTQANWWLNWDKEYKAWKDANLYVDVSIQFTNKTFPQYTWNTTKESAYHYGQEFAKHFGSTHGNGLVDAIEIGNEPWDYDANFYATVLKGMSAGVRSIDSNITIIPATFQAQNKHETNTYIGTRVLPEVANNIDVINCHTYSFVNTQDGVRTGTYPEHKESTFNNIRPIMRWRDSNTPHKPIWVTEWGWDSSGDGEICSFPECVSEQAQAVYAIRGLMILARSNIERATWFFYANTDCKTLFCRSGLTTSKKQNFAKKTVFVALEHILNHLGDAYFVGVYQETDKGFIYVFSKTINHSALNSVSLFENASHIVGWLPVDITNKQTTHVHVNLPVDVRPGRGWRFTCMSKQQPSQEISNFQVTGHTLNMKLTTAPVVIELMRNTGSALVG